MGYAEGSNSTNYYIVSAKPRGYQTDLPDWRTASVLSGHQRREVAEEMAASLRRHNLFGRVYLVCTPGELRGTARRHVERRKGRAA